MMGNRKRLAPASIATAAKLWKQGMGTAQIAALLMLPEYRVYNSLDAIRSAARR